MRNRAGAFAIERLMDFLTAVGQDVEITVRPTREEHARFRCDVTGGDKQWRVSCPHEVWRFHYVGRWLPIAF